MGRQRCVNGVAGVFILLALAACGGGGGGSSAAAPVGTKMGGAIQGNTLSLTNSVTVFAGSSASADGTGAAARFSSPGDLVSDGISLFVSDTDNSTIRKIDIVTGVTSTLAGSAGVTGASDGTGADARFNFPAGIALSSDKATLYVSDSGNNTIRRIAVSSGAVTTLAAGFNSPTGIVCDGADLYVADSFNHSIRKVVIATGAVSTFAGSGVQAFADGTGAEAMFNTPYGIATDGVNLYVTDNGNSAVRRILIATGLVSTLAEPVAGLASPTGIATDGTSLFVADAFDNVVRKIVIASQALSTLAGDAVNGAPGSTDATGGAARFSAPGGITRAGGNLYLADSGNGTIRQIVAASGVVATLAGTPASANGIGPAAGFKSPYDLTTDGQNIYVADTGSSTIRKIVIATGVVSTLAGSADLPGAEDGTGSAARFNAPGSITTDGTYLFVADTGNNTVRQLNIATGAVSTLAGTAGVAGAADGSGAAASFNAPGGITTDGTDLYLSDTGNNMIRKINIATGSVSTLASGLSLPYGITTDGTTLFVADAGSSSVVKVSIASGALSTWVSGLDFPTGITTDGKTLFVADSGANSVKSIVIATGVLGTVSSNFGNPSGLTTDGTTLYLADALANTVVSIR